MKLTYYVREKDNYLTVKEILLSQFQISKRLLTKLKQEKAIFLNNQICPVFIQVHPGDKIEVSFDQKEDNHNIIPTNMPLSILYEDEAYLVVNKPAGIPVHPSCYHFEDSLSNGVRYYFDSICLYKKIRPVNRIDRDTTGIVIFAKNEYVQESLIRQMNKKIFEKEYIAVVEGFFEETQGTICAPIARKTGSIMEREVSKEQGETAITHYHIIKEKTYQKMPISIVSCKLETGRTHQIRVHMAHISHPLIGDTLYNHSCPWIARQALHSYRCSFYHPITQNLVHYEAPIPEDMQIFLED